MFKVEEKTPYKMGDGVVLLMTKASQYGQRERDGSCKPRRERRPVECALRCMGVCD